MELEYPHQMMVYWYIKSSDNICCRNWQFNVGVKIRNPNSRAVADLNAALGNDRRQFRTGSSKKMDGIWNRYNLKSTRRIYTFGILKCSEKFKVLDLP